MAPGASFDETRHPGELGGKPPPASAEMIIGLAAAIGIDVVKEPEYLWIAEQAHQAWSSADYEWMREGWHEFDDEDGNLLYYNTNTRLVQKVHPIIDQFSQVYHKQRSFTKLMMEREAPADAPAEELAAVVQDIMVRQNQDLPAASPNIIERLCVVLGVDSSREFFLVRAVKHTLEAYIEKRFHLNSLAKDLAEPLEFLRGVRKQQVKVDVIRKPDTIIMCQECDKKSAIVKCEQCKDYFCQDCFNATHSTGKRRAHVTSDVEQLVCAAYDDRVATCQCVQCGLFYSDQGFLDVHASRPELHNHLKRVINGLVCLECEHFNASVLCEDCVDLFCTECFIRLHRNGRRKQHVHLTIDNTSQIFRGGYLVPPEEAQVLTDRARSTIESGPWLAFRADNGLDTIWYNLKEKVTRTTAPDDAAVGEVPALV